MLQLSQKGDDELFKSCALTAIGNLGAENQFEFLKERFKSGGYNDRYMAVKAIGDIGTPEALQFVRDQKNTDVYQGEGGLKSCVDLYTP
jgi:HEAT repeat protein